MSYRLRPFQSGSGFGMYGLRGLGADNVVGQVSPDASYVWDGRTWQPIGGGPISQPVFTPVVQPTNEICQPWDSPCIARNVALQTNYQIASGQDLASQLYGDCLANGLPASVCRARWPVGYAGDVPFMNLSPDQQAAEAAQGHFAIPAAAPLAAATASAAPSGGTVKFTTARGGSTAYPGDTWTVSIAGASPNAPVVVQGGKGGANVSSPMGTTDASGKFVLSGTFTADDIGSWTESWTVGGAGSGFFRFAVQPNLTPDGKQVVDTGSPASAPGGTVGKPGAPSAPPPKTGFDFSSFDLSKIPMWGWAAAAVGAFLVFGGKR